MRNMMVAATLVLAGCGTGDNEDTGSDMTDAGTDDGSDSGGMDAGMDTEPPQITLGPSTVRDERGDTIDFTSGEAVHIHSGPVVSLTATGCPVVHKYAYLTGTTDPLFGTQTAPNPIGYDFSVQDAMLVAGSTEYRVRTFDGQVLRDWTPIAPTTGDSYSVKLFGGTTDIAQLGTRSGQFLFDVRARDESGRDAEASFCWEQRLLAPPVEVTPLAPAELFQWSLAADSPVSRISVQGATVLTQRVTQHAGEPIRIAWRVNPGAVQYVRSSVDDIVTETSTFPIGCPIGTSDPRCQLRPVPAEPADMPASGTAAPGVMVYLFDEATNQNVTLGTDTLDVTLPARAANQPPRAYRIDVVITVPELHVPGLWAMEELSLLGITYTGGHAEDLGLSCLDMKDTAIGRICYRVDHFWRVKMLDAAKVTFAGITASFKTETPLQPLADAPYLSAAARSTGPLTWDAGNDDLPGALH